MRDSGLARRAFRVALQLALISINAIGVLAASPAQHPDARTVIAESEAIHTANGVEGREAVKIGGIPQWITVRGKDLNNPLLLYVHGGPGDAIMGASWSFQRPWEDYFTVVQWDQRGSGKTYASNDWERVKPTLTTERFVDDAEELVQYLRTKYHKRKIVLLGHSWGTVICTELAQRHPEWFSVYVGTGQVVNMRESERMGYEEILKEARAANDVGAVKDLEALAPYPGASGPMDFTKTMKERKWLVHDGGYTWRNTNDHYEDILRLSPDYTDADVKGYELGDDRSARLMWAEMSEINFWKRTSFRCPVVLFQGSHDLNVSHELVARWYATLHAPSKKLVWFPNSSHMVMMEEPGRMFYHLMTDIRPLAMVAQDTTPEGRVR
jgi:pimeloyl-ACP methyl ester carboxylesterase